MIGITSWGAYIPFYRLGRDELGRAWGSTGGGGQKAVAYFDEDSVTMAVAAARDCLGGYDGQNLGGLLFATTRFPYREKQAATIVASAIDCPKEAQTADIANSLRGGTIAMNFALDAIKSGRSKSVLVAASDCRIGHPRGPLESMIGDGASAVLLGESNVVAEIEESYSISNEFLDVWRAEEEQFLQSAEDRFTIVKGYNEIVGLAVKEIFKKSGLAPKDFAKLVMYSPDLRSPAALAKILGFDPKTQLQDSLIGAIGHTGAAQSLMMLSASLEDAQPGDRLLFIGYGDGVDVFILKVTDEISKHKTGRGIKKYLQSKTASINYEKYLLWRGLVDVEPLRRLDPEVPPPPALLREHKQIYALYGVKCKKCGMVQYPATRLCAKCQGKDDFELYKFSNKKAAVFTWESESATQHMDPPRVMAIIDIEGGGRMQMEVTDRVPGLVKIGLPVEMVFRKLQHFKGIHQYIWKCKATQ